MKRSMLCATLGLMISVPALAAGDTLPIVSFEDGAAAVLDVSECDKKFVEKIVKAEAAKVQGQHVVMIYTAAMVSRGAVSDGAEPLVIGALKTPATNAQVDGLIGKPACNEPF